MAEKTPVQVADVPHADAIDDGAMDPLADAALVPMDDAAGGPTADKEQMDEPSEEEAAAQLGDFA